MPIVANSKLSSTVANNTFLDKTVDDEKKGVLGLFKTANTDPDAIADVQDAINTNTDDIATINSSLSNYATLTGTQTLTNKTLTAPVINNAQTDYGTASDTQKLVLPSDTTANLTALTREEGRVYYSTDDDKILFDDGTNLTEVGSGGVGGGFNLEIDPYAQAGVGDWTLYQDGSATPVDMTGGTTTGLTITANDTTTQILSGSYAGAFVLGKDAADRQGGGVAKAFTIPKALQDKGYVYVSCRVSSDVALSTGDFGFYAYDVTNSELIPVQGLVDSDLVGLSADGTATFTGLVYIKNNTASLRLGFHIKNSDATATNYYFSDLRVSDSPVVDSPKITEWVSFTPSGTWTTNTTYTGFYRRVGDSVEVQVSIALSGAPNSVLLEINPVTGLTIDTSKISGKFPGVCQFLDTGTREYVGAMRYGSGKFIPNHTESLNSGNINQASPFTWASGDSFNCTFVYPVTEWANDSGVISTTESLNVNGGMSADKNSGNHTNTGSFQTITSYNAASFDDFDAFNATTGVWTAPRKGRIQVNGQVGFVFNATGSRGLAIRKNTSSIVLNYTDPSAIDTTFGSSVFVNVEKGDTIDMQGYQNSGGNLNYSTANSSTQLSINYIPDLSVYSIYAETEVLQANSTAYIAYPGAASTDYNLTSLTLTPGEWDLEFIVNPIHDTAGTAGRLLYGYDTTSGTWSQVFGNNAMLTSTEAAGTFADGCVASISARGIVVNSETTYYFKTNYQAAVTNLKIAYKAIARKIK